MRYRDGSSPARLAIGRPRPVLLILVLAGIAVALPLRSPVFAMDPSGHRIAASFGLHSPMCEDMRSIYGMVPMLGVRWTSPLGSRSQFLAGVGYAFDSGDPYYGEPDFVTDQSARLRALPFEFGVRTDLARQSSRALYVGAAMEYVWVREQGPDEFAPAGDGWPRYSGWGWGVKFLIGPEWEIREGRVSLGCEASLAARAVTARRAKQERKVDLSALGARVYAAVRL